MGFGLRKWQLASGFEPDTGLAIPGSPAALALLLWSSFVALGVILLCMDRKGPRTCQKAFAAQGNSLFFRLLYHKNFHLKRGGFRPLQYFSHYLKKIVDKQPQLGYNNFCLFVDD